MLNMKCKGFLVLLCMFAMFSFLIGCNSEDNSRSQSNSDSDSENKEINIIMADRGLQVVEASPDINNNEYVKELAKLTNTQLDIELLPWSEYEQNLTLVFAGGEYPDLMEVNGINSPEIAPAIEAEMFMPLNDLIEEHAPNLQKYITKEQWNDSMVSKDGNIYAIPSTNPIQNGNVVMVRKDWIDNLGIETPETVEEYIEMLRAFKTEDPNNNGEEDEIPFTARENFAFGEAFFGAYDVIPADWKYVDNELIPNFIRPEMKESLAVYKQLYDEKLLDNEFFVQQGKDWDSKIKGKGNAGMWIHSPRVPDNWEMEVKMNTSTAEIGVIPSPIGPDGKGGHSIASAVGGMVWAIPTTNENPIEAIKFLDQFYTEEVQTLLTYGLEGENYTVENGKIKYNYPTDEEGIGNETMHQNFLRFIGPSHLEDEEFLLNQPRGELVKAAIDIANNEGRVNDGLSMPIPPTLLERPELQKDGLWVEFAAGVLTGKEDLENFDDFVANWKERGGDKVVEEATEWYTSKQE